MKSKFVDWSEVWSDERQEWEFIGRSLLLDKLDEYSEDNEEGLEDDDGYPVYNYAYPIETFGELEDDKILRICEETSCTVVYNTKEDQYYLSLTGCGMDMSQSIALAYMIAYSLDDEPYGIIDWEMIDDVAISAPYTISEYHFNIMLKTLARQFRIRQEKDAEKLKEIEKKLETITTPA
jgi:hypothetical protein